MLKGADRFPGKVRAGIMQFVNGKGRVLRALAEVHGLEPWALGFGDRCSTN